MRLFVITILWTCYSSLSSALRGTGKKVQIRERNLQESICRACNWGEQSGTVSPDCDGIQQAINSGLTLSGVGCTTLNHHIWSNICGCVATSNNATTLRTTAPVTGKGIYLSEPAPVTSASVVPTAKPATSTPRVPTSKPTTSAPSVPTSKPTTSAPRVPTTSKPTTSAPLEPTSKPVNHVSNVMPTPAPVTPASVEAPTVRPNMDADSDVVPTSGPVTRAPNGLATPSPGTLSPAKPPTFRPDMDVNTENEPNFCTVCGLGQQSQPTADCAGLDKSASVGLLNSDNCKALNAASWAKACACAPTPGPSVRMAPSTKPPTT